MRAWGLLLAVGLAVSTMAGTAGAQVDGGATGTITGRVVMCRNLLRPIAGAQSDADEFVALEQTTTAPDPGTEPRLRARFVPRALALPVADAQITVPGTALAARTDATGRFVLSDVPAATPITLEAELPAARPLVVRAPDVTLSAGETVDLGTLSLSNCLDTVTTDGAAPTGVLTPLPEPTDIPGYAADGE
jgi:hypothetical protein